ncbi:MAG TPA: lipase family protein, partial [Ignavibacteria bacterium]
LQLNDSTSFDYQLSTDPKAMVHTGWTIGLGYLAPDIETKINEYYRQKHVKEFLLFGHSQGGAISFLLRSFLEYEKQKGKIPADIVFKTYCSAAPKPGNMYYAYDFDFITRNGWAFTIVNTADWVPETPFSIPTIHDLISPIPLFM